MKPETYHSKKNPFIAAMFDVSTCHITKKDNNLLIENKDPSTNPELIVYGYPEGYFIFVPDQVEDLQDKLKAEGYSKELINLLILAHQHDCIFLRLDADGVSYEDLPTFDW